MFAFFPYLWLAMVAAVIVSPIVFGLMNRPKKAPKAIEQAEEALAEEQPVLDFGDELAQMDK